MTEDAKKTIINIAAAAGKHRKELPVTYRPSVRDVCETSYSMGAKDFHAIGLKEGYDKAIWEVLEVFDSFRTRIDIPQFIGMRKELENLKK